MERNEILKSTMYTHDKNHLTGRKSGPDRLPAVEPLPECFRIEITNGYTDYGLDNVYPIKGIIQYECQE